jgi:protein-S-isoprenylcysteine O-methyltransferase Ste14
MLNAYTIIYLIWALSEVILNRFKRSRIGEAKSADRKSEPILWLTISLAIMASAYVAMSYHFPVFSDDSYRGIGLPIMLLGMIFRFWAIWQLGRYFTVDVAIRSDHQLLRSGLYKYLRHPSYTGLLITFFGYSLTLNNYLGMLIALLPVFIAFLFRIRIEESALKAQFGQEYEDYCKQAKRLIPFIY